MRGSPIVEAIIKENLNNSNSFSLNDSLLMPTKKKSKENIEENNDPGRKLKRKDSKKMSIINLPKKDILMKNLGFSFLMSSSFKKLIMEKLKDLQITVKFEVLTKKNLTDTLTKVIYNNKTIYFLF